MSCESFRSLINEESILMARDGRNPSQKPKSREKKDKHRRKIRLKWKWRTTKK